MKKLYCRMKVLGHVGEWWEATDEIKATLRDFALVTFDNGFSFSVEFEYRE